MITAWNLFGIIPRESPRKINILCDHILLIGYALEKEQITEAITKEAIEDLTKNPFIEAPEKKEASFS